MGHVHIKNEKLVHYSYNILLQFNLCWPQIVIEKASVMMSSCTWSLTVILISKYEIQTVVPPDENTALQKAHAEHTGMEHTSRTHHFRNMHI